MLQKFYFIQCMCKGWNHNELLVPGKDNFNYNTWDIATNTYLGAYRLLDSFLAVLQPGQVPLYKEGMFGYYNPESDRSRKTGAELFADDRALLMPYFTDMMTAIRGIEEWEVKDEFLRSIDELSKTDKVSFYAVFAAQIFLDITHKLSQDIERPFHTMMQQTIVMSNDITSHFDFHDNLKIENWPASNNRFIQKIQQGIQSIGNDPIRKVQARLYQRIGMALPDTKDHRIFRMSPVLCGLALYHFRQRYREAGLAIANASGSIQYAQHLHNALQSQKMLDSPWPDMDVLYTLLGSDSFYVGGKPPTTMEACFKMFCLQMGTSAAAMGKNRRKHTPLASKAGPRGLKEGSPVLSMFKARYVDNSGQVDLTPEHVDQIIELGLYDQEVDEESGTMTLSQIDDPEKLRKKSKLRLNLGHARKNAVDGGQLAPEKLVKSLTFALHAETLEFSFPYLLMHRWCWSVLRNVKEACDIDLRKLYGPEYIERESQLPWVVGWILMAASGIDRACSSTEPLQKSAGVLEKFVESGAGEFLITKVMGDAYGIPMAFANAIDDETPNKDDLA